MEPFAVGVAASLAAVILVEIYRATSIVLRKRQLGIALGLRTSSCSIVAPVYESRDEGELIPHFDTYAAVHLMELCRSTGVEPTIIPCNQCDDGFGSSDLIVIGGPGSNTFTESYVARFLPTLSIVRRGSLSGAEKKRSNSPKIEYHSTQCGYKIGDRFLPQTDKEEYVFLIRLSKSELEQNRSVHLLFGYSGKGTAACGYYFSRSFRKIAQVYGERSYCIATKMIRDEGYKAITDSFHDFSNAITKAGASPSRI